MYVVAKNGWQPFFVFVTLIARFVLLTRKICKIQPSIMSSKKIKKNVGFLWKEVMQDVAEGKIPSSKTVRTLLKNCEDFNLYADISFAAQWRQCSELVKKCVIAAQRGDFDTARENLLAVNQVTKECHRHYK